MKFRRLSTTGRLLSLLVNESSAVKQFAKIVTFKGTYKLIASSRAFTVTINDPTTRALDLATRNLSFSFSSTNLTKYDGIALQTVTLNAPSGWAYFDVTSISTSKRSVLRNRTVSIGDQVAYQTTTTTGQSVSITSDGFVTTGSGTFNFRIFNNNAWSSEFTFEANPVVTILTVDIDDQIIVGQTSANLTGTNVEIADFARVRYGSTILSMSNYTSGTTPTFNVPDLTTFFSSGMPLGTVSFEILKAV